MLIVSREQAMERLMHLMPALLGSVNDGWSRWSTKGASMFKAPTARTRASAVHDAIGEALEARTRGIDGVRFSRSNDRFLLFVGTDIVIEIHKLTDEHLVKRNQTSFAGILESQQLCNGLGKVAVLTLGYTHDELGADLREVLVVYLLNGKAEWDIDLVKEVAARPTPLPTNTAEIKRKKRRITAKKDGQAKEKKRKDGDSAP